ncbi:MAG: spore coat protein CotJB [Clostridia bacterium]|nr:spore coat protein CotJB [Clostridia bacterium]
MTENRQKSCMKTAADYAYPFALWDLRLYLDTHPDDREALETFSQMCAAYPQAGACRAGNMGMNDNCGCERWTWIDGPWPWEYDANRISDTVYGGSHRGNSSDTGNSYRTGNGSCHSGSHSSNSCCSGNGNGNSRNTSYMRGGR